MAFGPGRTIKVPQLSESLQRGKTDSSTWLAIGLLPITIGTKVLFVDGAGWPPLIWP